MYRLSIAGATVIHPDAILLGKQYNIPIRILSTFAGEPGTTISRDKSSLKITGAGLKIQENEYVISVIFNVNYRDEIIKKLERFLLNEQKYTVNRSYSDNSASIVVKNENIAEFLQELYLNFIK
jgi:aspartokinase